MELKSTMIEWWSGLDGPNGLASAPMSYGLKPLCRYFEMVVLVGDWVRGVCVERNKGRLMLP